MPDDGYFADAATEIAARAERELEALVAVSSPSGDIDGAEEAVALSAAFGPVGAALERVPCSTEVCAPDLILRIPGTGRRRLLLLGHLDTVIAHHAHAPLRRDGERLYGPGTADMKGGVVLALGVARHLAERPERFAELAVLLVVDEEWRTAPFAHLERFAGYDACLCFEAGERTADGEEGGRRAPEGGGDDAGPGRGPRRALRQRSRRRSERAARARRDGRIARRAPPPGRTAAAERRADR